ncbi:hypothetical protein RGU70_02900 [Herbaspirillum sp. RTI4]|uniref:hypothetical protein n=1 Tax=Herbaspirillum sp. RTI4 TaxID=3048640 RepID=UPI002AB3D0D5|nr:hypothetical protein [Herbaspirillum sp. RTI4]MDY7577278.1 hypothetical protein [Herbaspirillum sp. RTI4]MEA9982956.1 hypothetical protein [Herbaspirillum sp. RTI4]
MKKLPILTCALALTASILTGCVNGNASMTNESASSIQQKVIKGKTNKTELRATFGEPAETGINEGKEYWAYQMAQNSVLSFIPFSSIVTGSSGITGKYVRFVFDKKGIVESYSVSELKLWFNRLSCGSLMPDKDQGHHNGSKWRS